MEHYDRILERSEANGRCFDCHRGCHEHPWISVQHGIVLCINCAGVHRSLGVEVSFVRSLKLDRITGKDVGSFERGGNEAFAKFLKAVPTLRVWFSMSIPQRYYSPPADLYRRRLATVGGELPTDLRVITPPKRLILAASRPTRAKAWTPDSSAPRCELCMRRFTLLRRRHHCRRCGKCVCEACSPRACYRPIPPIAKPCRHCVSCVAVPSFDPRYSSSAMAT